MDNTQQATQDQPEVGAFGGGGDGHGFSFQAALNHHNMPYPAIEWLHYKPVLIFNLLNIPCLSQIIGTRLVKSYQD